MLTLFDSKIPSVYDFSDYRVYLKEMYSHLKASSNFSYGTFAEAAGLKSRSYFRLVVTGRRNLSHEGVLKFIFGLNLDTSEAEGFKVLVAYNQSTSVEAKAHYWERFLKLRPKEIHTQRIYDAYSYFARMAYPVLLILLRQAHITHDIKTLSHLAGLPEKQILEGIECLKNLHLIREIDGKYLATQDSCESLDDVPNVAIQVFHKNMLNKASEKIELSPLEREFQAVMVPLDKEEFEFVRMKLRQLAKEVDEKFSGSRPKSKKIYGMNLNLVPLTPEFIRLAKDEPSQNEGLVPLKQEKTI